jgi:glycosyltransferase involved in cell wall biosynthesis
MKILLTHPSADLYGSDRMALLAIEALAGQGHEVHAVVPVGGPLLELIDNTNASVVVKDIPVLRREDLHPTRIFGLLLRVLRSSVRIVRTISSQNPDVLYVNTIVQPWWVLAGKLMRRRVVVHVREAEHQSHPAVRKLLYGCLLMADLVICNSEATRREITSMVPVSRGRTKVIYNGKDWSKYRTDRIGYQRDASRRSPIALAVIGRLSHRKGQDVAIRALAELKSQGCQARLTIVGSAFKGNEGIRSELISLATSLGVVDQTHFKGFQHDIRSVLADTDIAIVPSRIEPFGTVAAECMAAGLLTIVSDVQGLTEIVEPDRNGLTFPAGDHQMLALRCMWAVDHSDDAVRLALCGQRDVDERFGLERYQRQIVEALEFVDVGRAES